MLNNKGFDLWADGYDKSVVFLTKRIPTRLPDTKRYLPQFFRLSCRPQTLLCWTLGLELPC